MKRDKEQNVLDLEKITPKKLMSIIIIIFMAKSLKKYVINLINLIVRFFGKTVISIMIWEKRLRKLDGNSGMMIISEYISMIIKDI